MNVLNKLLKRSKPTDVSRISRLRSCPCTQAQLQSDVFQAWVVRIHEGPMHMHRKVWEYCYITQALYERGLLTSGRRGLGFAVGQEPLSALFASLGCQIVATDLEIEEAQKGGWVETAQHADSLDSLNRRSLCDAEVFRQCVSFRFLDMRRLPDDLGTYDFIWSSCSLEHLGTLTLGEQFIYESLKYLKPGGVAVHTTEFNLQSNDSTVAEGPTVIFRKKDIQTIAVNLRQHGYRIDLDFAQGDMASDRVVDKPPYNHEVHLRLLMNDYIVTSYGMIIES